MKRKRVLVVDSQWASIIVILLMSVCSCWAHGASGTRPAHRLAPSGRPNAKRDSCPLRTDLPDEESKAFVAPVVFEGVARSKSPIEPLTGVYGVTLQVSRVYKGRVALNAQIRLQFKKPQSNPKKTSGPLLKTTSKHPSRSTVPSKTSSQKPLQTSSCLVNADLRTGKSYIIFASKPHSPRNYSVLAEPVFHTKRTMRRIRKILCRQCAKKPQVTGLKDRAVPLKKRMRLKCKSKGKPSPISFTWYKDGKILKNNKRILIRTKRKKGRSKLTIRRVEENDAGVYECRATNVVGKSPVTSKARIKVVPNDKIKKKPDQTSDITEIVTSTPSSIVTVKTTKRGSLWPFRGTACPISSFCLNGGTCMYYEAVGELVCQCAEGYKGQRCESKDVYDLGSVQRDSMGMDASSRLLSLFLGKSPKSG